MAIAIFWQDGANTKSIAINYRGEVETAPAVVETLEGEAYANALIAQGKIPVPAGAQKLIFAIPPGSMEPVPPPDAVIDWAAGTWAEPVPVTTAEMVKAEARRRILAVASLEKQLNLSRRREELRQMELVGTDMTPYADEIATIEQLFAQIDALRAASNVLEAMDPIPPDYADDAHWT